VAVTLGLNPVGLKRGYEVERSKGTMTTGFQGGKAQHIRLRAS
jgi:hypothetical protein